MQSKRDWCIPEQTVFIPRTGQKLEFRNTENGNASLSIIDDTSGVEVFFIGDAKKGGAFLYGESSEEFTPLTLEAV